MKKINILILIAFIILLAGGFYLYFYWKPTLKNVDVKTADSKIVSVQKTGNRCDVETPSSYNYRNKTVSYGCLPAEIKSEADHNTNVYITDGISKKDVIKQFPAYFPNTDVKFKKTSMRNIVLLTSFSGDLGGYFDSYYYIDLDSEKLLGMVDNSNMGLEVGNGINQPSKISLLVENNCDKNNGAILKDINLDGLPQHVITQPQVLLCHQGFDNSNTFELIKYIGANKDLSKIFFSVSETSWNENTGKTTNIFMHNYSYDLINKRIIEESPIDIL